MKLAGGYVIVLSRGDEDYEHVLIGPFRSKARAERRANVIARLAATYEDPEGAVGDDNILDVSVETLWVGHASASNALGLLYGAITG